MKNIIENMSVTSWKNLTLQHSYRAQGFKDHNRRTRIKNEKFRTGLDQDWQNFENLGLIRTGRYQDLEVREFLSWRKLQRSVRFTDTLSTDLWQIFCARPTIHFSIAFTFCWKWSRPHWNRIIRNSWHHFKIITCLGDP